MEPLFFKAENKVLLLHSQAFNGASMEPLFFKAENGLCNLASSDFLSLQWSRFFSKRKIYRTEAECEYRREGFNGAAFFQSGKSCTASTTLAAVSCFNGAAFFQSGK